MARKPRLHLEGGVYHVVLRGNDQQDIFFHQDDRHRLYQLLDEGTRRFHYRVHAFCLMSNHIHLAIQAGSEPLSRAVQNFAFRYARWINKRQGRSGHLFQGRYWAALVDADSYLLQLVRYIHMNPVHANLVRNISAYPWTSHRAYLGHGNLAWLCTDLVLGMLGSSLETARRAYMRFMSDEERREDPDDFYAGNRDDRIITDEAFTDGELQRIEVSPGPIPSLDWIISYVCTYYGIQQKDLIVPGRKRKQSAARRLISWLSVRCGIVPMTKVAVALHRDASTVSRNFSELEAVFRNGGPRARELSGHLQNARMQA